MKNKIRLFLAKEWLILISFLIIGGIVTTLSNSLEQYFCYESPANKNTLTSKQLEVIALLDNRIKEEGYLSYELRNKIYENKEKFYYLIKECDSHQNNRLSTKYFFHFSTESIFMFFLISYITLFILRVIIILTKSSLEIVKKSKQ